MNLERRRRRRIIMAIPKPAGADHAITANGLGKHVIYIY
jgi:hypothetical protein